MYLHKKKYTNTQNVDILSFELERVLRIWYGCIASPGIWYKETLKTKKHKKDNTYLYYLRPSNLLFSFASFDSAWISVHKGQSKTDLDVRL